MLQQSILCFNTSTIKCRAYRIVSTTLIQVGKAPYRIVSATLIQVAHTHYRIVSQGFPIKSRAREHFSVLKTPRENHFKASTSSPFLQWKFKQGCQWIIYEIHIGSTKETLAQLALASVNYLPPCCLELGAIPFQRFKCILQVQIFPGASSKSSM